MSTLDDQFLQPRLDSTIMDRELDGFQPASSVPLGEKEPELLQNHPRSMSSEANLGSASFHMNTPPFTCSWTGCTDKSFARKSELKKHWEKHTKPYVCEELECNSLAFGDKAGLHRHETEKHGKHNARRYLCPVQLCPRASKGFPRKRNRDVHLNTRHQIQSAVGSGVFAGGIASATPESTQSRRESLNSKWQVEGGDGYVTGDVIGLTAKLMQLEKEKEELEGEMKELSIRHTRKVEDIQALKRTMQLVVE